ncbi:potassium channel family protein [Inquilinus sp. OTU3971]|uniref:potassium channel family protein n=1 Tax=Inquilinus sp. OTU3971 TaxID=3043855 RepID=UPI00313D7DE9
MISITVLVHTIGLMILTRAIADLGRHGRLDRQALGRMGLMVATVLGLFVIHTAEIWLWALAYVALGAFTAVHDALYFSTTTFSTIGYGDLVLDHEWRLLGALEGVSGFLLIGWSTAYLVAASTRHGPFRLGEHF